MSEPDSVLVDRLHGVGGFLFDMVGTLVLGDRTNHKLSALPGAREVVEHLQAEGVAVGVLTNGTARPPAAYAATLRSLGFALDDEVVLTPAAVAAALCVRRHHQKVMVLGGEGVGGPLRDAGIEVVEPKGRPTVDAVLVGWFREVGFDHLEAACHAVWGGARLYSASQSLYFASADGKAIGTSRAICAVIKDLTGVRPTIVGKPSLEALRTAARRLGTATKEMAVVGDDPELEVPMAHRGRSLAIAVNTGIGNARSFDHLDAPRRPHLVLDGLDDLLALYRAGGPGGVRRHPPGT